MTDLRTADFDYNLPPELIAQTPIEPRDHARLLVLRRDTGTLEHRRFFDLPDLLRPGDLLVFNESRVIPARLLGRKEDDISQSGTALSQSQGAAIEVLLLREREPGLWEALVRRARRLKVGDRIVFDPPTSPTGHEQGLREGPDQIIPPHPVILSAAKNPSLPPPLIATLEAKLPSGARLLRLSDPAAWERLGHVPLPPYIHAPLSDPERYQTIYARPKGSVAAPTAGLHFTPALLERLRARGVELAFLTLHISWDTFRPVTEDDPRRHKLLREWCSIPTDTVARLRTARREGRRIVAVGTTATRALEWAAAHIISGSPSPLEGEGKGEGEASKRIQPPILPARPEPRVYPGPNRREGRAPYGPAIGTQPPIPLSAPEPVAGLAPPHLAPSCHSERSEESVPRSLSLEGRE